MADTLLLDPVESAVSEALTTPLPLYIIAGVLDITSFISVPSYKVNLLDRYEEWTDSNKIVHRDLVAKKIEGTFDLFFSNPEDFYRFMATVKEYKKQNTSIDCTVYCVNAMEAITCEMYMDFEPSDTIPYIGLSKDYEKLTVTVLQRGNQYIS